MACLVPLLLFAAGSLAQNLPNSAQIRYIPHVVTGGGFVTKLTIANLVAAPNNVTVNFISSAGTLLSSTQYALGPAAALRIATPEAERFGPLGAKWAIVGSDQNVGINLFFEINGGGGPNDVVNTIGFNDAPAQTTQTLPVELQPSPVAGSIGRSVGLALANPFGVSSTATLTLVDGAGITLATTTIGLGAFGQTSVDLQTIQAFKAVLPQSNFVGTLRVSGTSPLSAIALGDDFGPFFSTPPVAAGRTGQLIIPHIVTGGGFVTKLTLMNLSGSPNPLDVKFFDQNGNLLQAQTVNLAANGTARIATPEANRFGPLQVTWGIVTAPNPAAVNLFFEIENDPNTHAVINTVGFNDVVPATNLTIPVEFMPTPPGSAIGRTVGLALANASSAVAHISLQLVNQNGQPIAMHSFAIPSMGQLAIDLSSLPSFQSVLPAADFIGTVGIFSDQPVAAIALGDDLGPFFSTPSLGPGPLAAPTSSISVAINPASASLPVGGSQQFNATVTGTTNTAVTWWVNGVAGGNSSVGTISPAGLYTAPVNIAILTRYTVSAMSQATTSAAGSVLVSVIPAAPPVVTSVAPTSGPATGGTAVTINGSGFQAGATVTVGGVAATNVIVSSATRITANTGAHAAGAADVRVTNPDTQSGTLTGGFLYVAVASGPSVTGISPNSGPASGNTNITITGTSFQSGATVSVGGVAATSVVFVSAMQLTAVTPAHSSGTVAVTVTNTDGQSGSLGSAFTYGGGPTISNITPSLGPATLSSTVTITGTNFVNGATVLFGSVASMSVSFISSTQLQVTVPPQAAGTVTIRVTNPDGQFATASGAFTYTPGPSLSSITPNLGSAAGGGSITIVGGGFQAGAMVQIGTAVANNTAVMSGTQITATTPPTTVGTLSVTVTNPDGQSATLAGAFTSSISFSQSPSLPTITGVSPSTGFPGTTITITGSNYQSGATVQVGGVQAGSVSLLSGSQIQASTPAHAPGVVDVQVTNPDANSAVLVDGYAYIGVSISSVTPVVADINGGTVLTITGTGFNSGASVLVGALAATLVTVNSSTQIIAVAPGQPAGTVASVKVTNSDGGTATLAGAVTYGAPPRIGIIAPTSGLSTGGTTIVISGAGFVTGTNGSQVSFGGVQATNVTVNSATQITVVTPPHGVGMVTVQVTNPDGASDSKANGFRYGTKIFSDGFESGSFVNWPGTPGFGVFAPTINSLPQFVHSGLFSASDEYSFCGVDQPTATVNLSTVVGGSLPGTTYFVKYAYIWPGFGETRASVERTISVPAGSLPVISSPPPATLLTQWSVYISTSSGTETRQNSGPIPIGTSFTLPTSGLVAGATPATGSACGASHQDLNRYFATSVGSPGLDHFFIRGWVYLKAPEPDVTPNASVVGRKLMYLKTDPSGGLDHLWAVIVGPQQLPGSSQVGTLPFAVDSTLVPSQSFFSNTALNFNTWYPLEVEVQANTPGVSDGVGRVYLNGGLVFEQTGINFRGNSTLGISRFELGRQVDRDNFDPFHEFHFWDDVVIADAYIGP